MNAPTSLGLLILRVGLGVMMIVGHGWPKISGYAGMVDSFPDPIALGPQLSLIAAIAAEVVCSVLLILGLLTRLAAIPLAITMGVALMLVHAADPWNVKELAAVYLTAYVALILTGPGAFSIDHAIWKRRLKKTAREE